MARSASAPASSLAGMRIWLSGAVPKEAAIGEGERIRDFVALLAREVFKRGGTIVHGSHPTIRDVLLAEAKRCFESTKRKAPLVLVVSRYYSKDSANYGIDIPAWNALCDEPVIQTAEVAGVADAPDRPSKGSLTLMRRRLADLTNVIVAVGGRWWATDASEAGVPEEIDIARHYHMPLFLLGGLGGATAGYLEKNPDLLSVCHNGLSLQDNFNLVASQNIPDVVAKIVAQLERLSDDQTSREGLAIGGATQRGDSGAAEGSARAPKRILCLDGGGIRGTFTAAVLERLESLTGKKIIDHFDLIVGTSTGGILAIGLAMGIPPAQILDFYKNDGPAIFPDEEGIGGAWLELQHWFTTKFDASLLEERLRDAFRTSATVQSDNLADALVRVAVTTYDAESDLVHVYRTPHIPNENDPERIDRIEAALATSAAPTYFSARQIAHRKAIDGGVWANAPTSVALAEAGQLGWDLKDVLILSIGTTYTPNLLARPWNVDRKLVKKLLSFAAPDWLAWSLSWVWRPVPVQGKIGWIATIASLLMKTQAQSAEYVCRSLLREGSYVRIDHATVETPMDKSGAINRLIGEAYEEARINRAKVEFRFLNGVTAARWTKPAPASLP